MSGRVGLGAGDRRLEVFLSAGDIDRRVAELGESISQSYRGQEVMAIGLLRGVVPFLADLGRRIDSPVSYEFIQVASYEGGTEPQGPPRILARSAPSCAGRHVLLVDDIIDTGASLYRLRSLLLAEGPASLRLCVLLDKVARRKMHVPLDWVGFVVPDRFVVGYGLDLDQRYRNLPYLAFLDGKGG